MTPWELVASVNSETNQGHTYEVKRNKDTGALGCACIAFRFSKGTKTCKHLEALRQVVHSAPLGVAVSRAVVADETFTVVRRAITFGAVGGTSERASTMLTVDLASEDASRLRLAAGARRVSAEQYAATLIRDGLRR